MEKYLKINWSIRCIVGLLSVILVFLILSNIFGLIFFQAIKESLDHFGSKTLEKISIGWVIASLVLQFGILYILAKIIDYKRWAVVIIGVFIGIPAIFLSLWIIGYSVYGLYDGGLDGMMPERWMFYIFCILVTLLTGFFIKFNRELFRLYRNIKDFDTVERKMLRDTKPNFLYFLLIAVIPFGLGGILMMVYYNPVIPLDIPEGYFKINGFNLDNPTYTDQEICKNFESEIGKMNERVRHINKDDTNSGVILAKEALFSYQSNTQNKLNPSITDEEKEKIKVRKMRKIAEFKTYIQNYPEQWNKALSILRSQLTTESVIQLQKLTHGLPQNTNCNIRNDQNIAGEFFPRLTQYLVTSRLYDAAIKLALLENNKELSVEFLKSFHEFNAKFYNSNTNLVGGMIGNAILSVEFGSVEYIIENTDLEQIEKIREIYTVPYNTKKNQINAWKGEYYFFEHVLTGRSKSIKQVSIPYLFNGEDMLNRAIILVYAGAIAEVQNDTNLLQGIKENKKLNNDNFLTGTERSFIGEGVSTWRGGNMLFARFYNPIGKVFIESLIPSYTSYAKRYNSIGLHQDYIRYELLGIEEKK